MATVQTVDVWGFDINNITESVYIDEMSACPGCGEREVGTLSWIEEYLIECHNCNTVYNPDTVDIFYSTESDYGGEPWKH